VIEDLEREVRGSGIADAELDVFEFFEFVNLINKGFYVK